MEEKVVEWHKTTDWILESCEKKGYLIETGNRRRVSVETAKNDLKDFLKDTEWLIRKCGVCDTQAIESFNSIKAKVCPKSSHFTKSFQIRCQIYILRWNDKILKDQISAKCQKILDSNKESLQKWREKSKEIEVRIKRNIKRRNARLKNRIKPEGHQYLDDENDGEKKSMIQQEK